MTILAQDIEALMRLGHNLEKATELAIADRSRALPPTGVSDVRLSRIESLLKDSIAIANALIIFADTSFNSPNVPVASEIPIAEDFTVGVSVSMVVGNSVRNSWQYYLALWERRLVGTQYRIIRSRRTVERICIARRNNPNDHLLIIPNAADNRYMKAMYVIFFVQCNGDMEFFINHYNEYLTEENLANCCALSTPGI